MANRYKRNSHSGSRKSKNSGSSLTGVFVLLGIVIGILLTSAGYMFFSKQSINGKTNSENLLVKARSKSAKKEKDAAQRFEFYTLLPGMEVQLPDATQTAHAKNQTPNAQKKNEPVNVLVQPVASRPVPPTVIKEPKDSKNQSQHQSQSIAKTTADHSMSVQNTNIHPKQTNKNTVQTTQGSHNTQNTNSHHSAENAALQYILQAGIFQELNLADELKAKLTLQGFNTRIQKVQTQEGQTWFRVTLGPFPSESNALQQKQRLEAQKIHGILILQRPNA